MISTFLVEHSALVPVTLLLVVMACVGVGYLVLRRFGQRTLWVLVALSGLLAAALTLSPTPGRSFVVCAVQFSVPSLGSVELLANVALFFPPVFFVTLATRRPLLMLVAGAGLSAAIEVIQAAVPEIGRACDTNDWVMNTAGAALAAVLGWATLTLTDRLSTGVDRPVDDSN